MPSFIWAPDYGASKTIKHNVIETQFGDGYSQRQQVGLNATKQEWSLSFSNRSQAEADSIDSFLQAQGGVIAFDFTTPDNGSTIKVLCRSGNWSRQILKGNIFTISAKFEQVFEP